MRRIYTWQWTLNLLDKDGNSITGAMLQFKPDSGAEVQIMEFLKNGIINDTLAVTFSQTLASKDELKTIMKEATSFELTTVIESIVPELVAEATPEETATKPSTTQPAQKPQSDQTTTTSSPTATPVQPSEDWDKELDTYSAAIDRYISMKKSIKPNDPNSIRRLNEQKS